tara:strand:- start:1062 stop:1391 length:330 start_codon:yes stop_codon:yes gene_type:complete
MIKLQDAMPGDYPVYPLDLSQKKHQQYARDIALRGVEEIFEALAELKNWKPHRQTEVAEFDKDKFLEEIVDAFNYFLTLILLAGFDHQDLFEMYCTKDKIINERLETGY